MDYNELIKNWHAKATDEDYFSKFVFEYLAFVAFLKKKMFTSARNDRHAIQMLKREKEFKDKYLAKITNSPGIRQAWQDIKTELDDVPLGNVSGNGEEVKEIEFWNCSHDESNQKTEKEKQEKSGVIHGLEDWENMVEFWYSARNNLFHGSKNPGYKRDCLLVKNGYKTLKPLVELFLLR